MLPPSTPMMSLCSKPPAAVISGMGRWVLLGTGMGAATSKTTVPTSSSSSLAWASDGAVVLAWQGCSGDEREMAKSVADIISKMEKPVIAEGQEPPEFWLALGGKSQYANSKRYQSYPYPCPWVRWATNPQAVQASFPSL